MKPSRLKLLSLISLLLAGGFAAAAEPVTEPLKANAGDVLKLLGAHAWKWTHRSPTPYKEITIRLVRFVRAPSGKFDREEFSSDTSTFIQPHTSDDVLIVCGAKDGHATFVVAFGDGVTGPQEQASIAMDDYSRSGSGDGGLPQMIGEEYMLMTRFKDRKMTDNKDDLLSYVSAEIATK